MHHCACACMMKVLCGHFIFSLPNFLMTDSRYQNGKNLGFILIENSLDFQISNFNFHAGLACRSNFKVLRCWRFSETASPSLSVQIISKYWFTAWIWVFNFNPRFPKTICHFRFSYILGAKSRILLFTSYFCLLL